MSRSKSPAENHFNAVDSLNCRPLALIYPVALERLKQGKCVRCQKPIKQFRDEPSLREYQISGLCQSCQDFFFLTK
ncbi:MAG: hypothetical protein ACOC44_01285 [Promethearchaeia archaeon]